MGGLAHLLERSGIATAYISLIREHTEAIRPTRALWVPFDLGRPFGPPHERAFQLDVLRGLLALFPTAAGPTIADYPHEAPATEPDEGPWACPVALPARDQAEGWEALRQRLLDEAALLRPWYEEARQERERTSMGVSGLGAEEIEQMVAVLAGYASGEAVEVPPKANRDMPELAKYIADDLKAFYYEAATAQPGRGSPGPLELDRWLFHETVLGDVIYRIRDRLAASSDERARQLPIFLVPTAFTHRPGT